MDLLGKHGRADLKLPHGHGHDIVITNSGAFHMIMVVIVLLLLSAGLAVSCIDLLIHNL